MNNVIGTVKEAIINCLKDREVSHGVHIDYTDPNIGDIGLFPVGPTYVKKDILGNPQYKMVFTLYSQLTSYNDYDRTNNANFLASLTYSLNKLKNVPIEEQIEDYLSSSEFSDYATEAFMMDEKTVQGKILTLDCGNGMLYDYPNGDKNDGVRYQIQITVNYKLLTNEMN